jgi:hypothetical protein
MTCNTIQRSHALWLDLLRTLLELLLSILRVPQRGVRLSLCGALWLLFDCITIGIIDWHWLESRIETATSLVSQTSVVMSSCWQLSQSNLQDKLKHVIYICYSATVLSLFSIPATHEVTSTVDKGHCYSEEL